MFSQFISRNSSLCSFLLVVFNCCFVVSTEAADIPQDVLDLQVAARQYMEANEYDLAQVNYQKILNSYPQTDYSLEALHQLSIINIKMNNIAASKESVAALLKQFPDRAETAAAIKNIGDCYYWDVKNYSESLLSYQRVIADWPDHPDVVGAYQGIACCAIGLGDFKAAEKIKDKLLAEYSTHKDIAYAMSMIAGRYFWDAKKYPESRALYQQIITNWPDYPDLMKAYQGLACCSICLGDFTTAEAAKDKLLAEYSGHKDIANAVMMIADRYFWDAQKYPESRALYQQIITNWPDYPDVMKAYQGLACCSINLGDLSTAETAKGKLLADFSEHKDIPNALMRIADGYFWSKNFSESRPLYERMIKDWPDHPDAIWAYQGLACSAIGQGDLATVEMAKNVLMKDYSDNKDLPGILMRIANRYYWDAMNYSESRALYQEVITRWSNHPDVMSAYQGLARCSVYLGDFATAQASTDRILSYYPDHKGDDQMIEYLNEIAWLYNEKEAYQEAEGLYQYVLDRASPGNENVVVSRVGKIISQIGKNEDAAAIQSQIDEVLVNYAGSPKLPESIFMLGEHYYLRGERALSNHASEEAKANFMKAIDVWKNVINQTLNSHYQCLAYYYSAVILKSMEQYEEAIQYYQMVVDQYPQYQKRWYALYSIAHCYDELRKQGVLTIVDAAQFQKAVYKELLEKYPDCPVAEVSSKKLNSF